MSLIAAITYSCDPCGITYLTLSDDVFCPICGQHYYSQQEEEQ